jgi:hypothetical protein
VTRGGAVDLNLASIHASELSPGAPIRGRLPLKNNATGSRDTRVTPVCVIK